MNFLSLLRVETERLFRSRRTWLFMAIVILAPAAGLWIYRSIYSISASSYATSLNGTYLGNPALAGALLGAAAFGLLTVFELDRTHRNQMDALTDAMVSPLSLSLARTLALLLAAVAVQLVVLIVWLPFTSAQIGSVFRGGLYVCLYLLIMLPPMVFAILFAAAAYQLTRRLDLTLVLFAVFLLLSMSVWEEHWLLRWVNPPIGYLSDDFGNTRLLRSIAWNRLFWLLVLGGFWCLSFLGVRRYGRGLFRSAARNVRKAYLPVTAALLAAAGCWSYIAQPFLDHSRLEITDDIYNVEYCDAVTYSAIHVEARPDLQTGCQWGAAAYQLQNDSGQPQTVTFRVNPGYTFSSVTANGSPVTFRDLNDDDLNGKTIEVDLPSDGTIELVIEYGGFPQEWNILETMQGDMEISGGYIYLTNQSFAPMPWNIDWSADDPPLYTADLSLPEGMTPVVFGTGTTARIGTNPDGTARWRIEDTGRSIILYAGDYVSHTIETAGINVEFFYSQKHQRVMEECGVDDVISRVFEYCTSHYGALQFYEDDAMRLIEIGSAGGGYAGDGASVMGEDSFNEQGLNDPDKGASGSEVLAHEIIHQWWGLGNMFDSGDYGELWSSEGLTVYTTYRMMKELYGDAYAQKHYVDYWQEQLDSYYNNFYVRNPEYLEALPEEYRADITNSLASIRQYCEMPLKILKAEQLVGGEERMDQILSGLFNREIDDSYPYLTYQEFLDTCGLTEEDLNLE